MVVYCKCPLNGRGESSGVSGAYEISRCFHHTLEFFNLPTGSRKHIWGEYKQPFYARTWGRRGSTAQGGFFSSSEVLECRKNVMNSRLWEKKTHAWQSYWLSQDISVKLRNNKHISPSLSFNKRLRQLVQREQHHFSEQKPGKLIVAPHYQFIQAWKF